MSRNENKDKHFEEFRRKIRKREEPADDFEKEAMEGFAMLGSEQEQAELKQQLDQRMEKQLSVRETSAKRYWFAAAALLIVAGFSIYFLGNLTNERKNVAIHEVPAAKQEAIVADSVYTPPPAVEEQETPEPAASSEKAQELKADAPPPKGKMTLPESSYNWSSTKDEKNAEAAVSQDADIVVNRSEATPVIAPSVPPMAQSANTYTINGASAGMISTGASTYTYNNNTSTQVVQMTPPSEDFQLSEIKASSHKESVAKKKSLATNVCLYNGGDKALKSEIQKKLQPIDLSVRFEARLFVNQKGKVDSVIITQSKNLRPEDQAKIIKQLKTLDKFTVHMQSENPATLAEYYLRFVP